ncbi:tripartite motif-containing 58 [Moniliophthora roreri]|nr:tripartite motif-containing 58 [Moniliophthora roreri]
MPLCSICLDELKAPVSISCVNAKKSCTNLHSCPSCRSPFSIMTMDPALVPAHLRPYIVPSIRKLYLDESPAGSSTEVSSSTSSLALSECNRLTAENTVLRTNCCIWRRRAETHAAATFGLLNVARMAKQRVIQLEHEKEELERSCTILKRKLEAEEALLNSRFGNLHHLSDSPTLSSSDPATPSCLSTPELTTMPCSGHWLDMSSCPTEDHGDPVTSPPPTKRRRREKVASTTPVRRSRRRHTPYTRPYP